MRMLYLDCPMGISGDMCLGALVGLGVPLAEIEGAVASLGLTGYKLSLLSESRKGITGTRLLVEVDTEHHHRSFLDIKGIINDSSLASGVKELATEIFSTLARAEASVHGVSVDEVHFHEVGALDSIIDIVGVAAAIVFLDVERVSAGTLALGSGWVDTEHGRLPVPAPATLELTGGLEVTAGPVEAELTTPTGAAIIKTLISRSGGESGRLPDMKVAATSSGLGSKDFKEAPNMVRAILGEAMAAGSKESDVIVVETNIDDMSPQIAGFLLERLLEAGALDAYFTPVQMKKSRPGVLLTVLTTEEKKKELTDIIFSESTSIGIRSYPADRICLERKVVEADTSFGPVRVKVSYLEGRAVNHQIEYEDARSIALERGLPLKEVIDEVRAVIRAGLLNI